MGRDILAAAGGAVSGVGSGGMITKIKAARVLMAAGIPLVICQGRRPACVVEAAAGVPVGTLFTAPERPHEITPKKLWIALGDAVHGTLVVDEGARAALVERGKSLLSVGIAEGPLRRRRHRGRGRCHRSCVRPGACDRRQRSDSAGLRQDPRRAGGQRHPVAAR